MDVDGDARLYYDILNVPKNASPDAVRKAFRSLSGTFHPDKHQNSDLEDDANSSFRLIQEAYEVLSNPRKRNVYDVYGRGGLHAGLELVSQDASVEELRRSWQAYRDKVKGQELLASAAPACKTVVRVHAVRLVKALMGGDLSDPRMWPVIPSVNFTTGVTYSATDKLDVRIGGNSDLKGILDRGAMRTRMLGESGLVASAMYSLTENDTLTASAMWSTNAATLAVGSRRRLTPSDLGSVTLQVDGREGGVAMAAQLERQLFADTKGSVEVQLPLQVLEAGVEHSFGKASVAARLQVGATMSAMLRYIWQMTPTVAWRLEARLSVMGVHAELGIRRRWQSGTHLGYAVRCGSLTGTTLHLRAAKAGHVLEVPIAVANDIDVPVLMLATVAPPVLNFLFARLVVRPLMEYFRPARSNAAADVEELRTRKQRAVAQQRMMQASAQRTRSSDATAGSASAGFRIVKAVYGDVSEFKPRFWRGAVTFASPRAAASPRGPEAAADLAAPSQPCLRSNGNGPHANGGVDQMEQRVDVEPYLDVTAALRFLAGGGHLNIPADRVKANLLGFADVNPGAEKRLYVVYESFGKFFELDVPDDVGVQLPVSGSKPLNDAQAQYVQQFL